MSLSNVESTLSVLPYTYMIVYFQNEMDVQYQYSNSYPNYTRVQTDKFIQKSISTSIIVL